MSGRVAKYGMLTALSFLFGYVETWIPFSFGIPGVKLGLANLVTLTALYIMRPKDAFRILLIRVVLTAFTFGNLSMMLYSLAGGCLSFLTMVFCKKKTSLSCVGVSVAGGVSHNLGQILLAAIVLENQRLFYYFPFLLAAGTAAGLVIGLLGGWIIGRLPDSLREQKEGAQHET